MLSLSGLSDQALLSRIQTLTEKERTTTLTVVLHLNEIERRRLHLKMGYSSLFSYCTGHLKYSASAAWRRIQTARCIRRFPEVYEMLRRGEVNLTTVSTVAPVLSSQNKAEILPGVRGKSQREVEALVARYRPPVALRDLASDRYASPCPSVQGLPRHETVLRDPVSLIARELVKKVITAGAAA